jgi:hypothetical protein
MASRPAPCGADMTVVICAFTVDRWHQLQGAVRSVLAQHEAVHEIIVMIDHHPGLLDLAEAEWPPVGRDRSPGPTVRVAASAGARGLSGARNTGVSLARGQIVAFLDDDACADPRWSERLLGPYSDPLTIACGGAAEPDLAGARPAWWPLEFDWVVGCSYVGLPSRPAPVRNLIGANMSARRAAVVEVGGFAEGMGRIGARPLGCEETDLFIRMARRWPDARIVYEPGARVHHCVPQARMTWRYFRTRCFAEGLSKAKVAARVGRGPALASERSYALRVLPRGMARALIGGWHGEEGAILRALAMGAGLLVTSAGYTGGRISGAISPFFPPGKWNAA